jgi:hypothetical protein
MEGTDKLMEAKQLVREILFLMPLGLMISSVAQLRKNVPSQVLSILISDAFLGLAVLGRDPAIGQCVSYYKLTVDFRQEVGTFPSNIVITAETPVRLSASLLVNRDPLDLGGEVTHLFALPASHSLQSSLATITLHTDEFGERTSHIALWNVCKSTSALHATFSQLTTVSNIPAPKDEAVVTQRAQVLIVVLDIA